MSERTAYDAIDRYTSIAASIAGAQPSEACELRASEPATVIERLHPHRLSLEVTEVISETPTTTTLRMASTGPDLPPFLAGQYVNLFVELDGTRTSRPYAISSAPAERDHYDLTVREVTRGFVSPHLVRRVRRGDRFHSTGPMGEFFRNPLFHGDRLMFLAGGSGVAPARSMIRDITARGGTSRLHLVYGSRDRSDIIFREELDELARAHDTIEIAHVISEPDPGWDGRTGFITGDLIAELAGPHLHRITYYLCGPPAMYDFCLDALQRLDIARRRVRYEANGPPAEPGRLRGWPGQLDPATTVVVNVDGRGKFEAACGEPLLNSLERAGYQLEAGCRSGHCSLCRVKILSGAVVSGPEARIRRSDEWTGHTHACTAFPVSDVEVQL
ncbi:MAG: FAD-binding oxidoreductase [Streptosporangiaceae bacterium]|jgi:ferredoxin-NADP reductase